MKTVVNPAYENETRQSRFKNPAILRIFFVLVLCPLSLESLPVKAAEEFVPAILSSSDARLHLNLVYGENQPRASKDSGAVEVTYIVDKGGVVRDVGVLRSTNKDFEEVAMKSVLNERYIPARVVGKNVDSHLVKTIVFDLYSEPESIKKFDIVVDGMKKDRSLLELHSVFMKKVEGRDRTGALSILESMTNLRSKSIGRIVNLALVRLQYSEAFSEPELRFKLLQELDWLQRLDYEGKKDLDAQTRLVIRVNLLTELINRSRYVEAIELYETMSKEEQVIRKFASAVEEIQQIQKSADPIQQTVLISDSGDGHHRLFKRSFSVELESGNLDQIELRCDTKFTRMEFEPDKTYAVPKRWGDCLLSLLGAPGTKGILLEK